MAVRIINRAPEGVTPEMYKKTSEIIQTEADPPEGMILHSAAMVDGRMTTTDIWESEEAYLKFREERLLPAIEQTAGPEAIAGEPEHECYELIGLVKP